eukprot:13855802-Alexandrium_andersonii.AAC.1
MHAQSPQLLKLNCPGHSPGHPRASACHRNRPSPGSTVLQIMLRGSQEFRTAPSGQVQTWMRFSKG